MNGKVRIKSNELVVAEAGTLIIIDATCRLLLETTDNRHIIMLNLFMQDDRRMYSYGYYFFSTYINPNDAENLTQIIHGETVRIGWQINGYAYHYTVECISIWSVSNIESNNLSMICRSVRVLTANDWQKVS